MGYAKKNQRVPNECAFKAISYCSDDLFTSLLNSISFRFSAEEIKKEENIMKYNHLAFSRQT